MGPTASVGTLLLLLPIGALLFSERMSVNGQETPAASRACYAVCDATWKSLLTEVSSQRTFLERYQNSSKLAGDYYCKTATNVTNCFDKCKEKYYPQYLPSFVESYNSALKARQMCTTDDGKCRAMDSRLWCNAYSPNVCDIQQSYEKCVRYVQAQRGCSLGNPTSASQKAVLMLILDARLLCMNDYNVSDNDALLNIQACVQYVPTECLANFTDSESATYSPYYSDMFSCSVVQAAKDCFSVPRTQTIEVNGWNYTKPCSFLPKNDAIFTDLSSTLDILQPSKCLPPVQTTPKSTAVSMRLNSSVLLSFCMLLMSATLL